MKNNSPDKKKACIAVIQDSKSFRVLAAGETTENLVRKMELEKKVFLLNARFDVSYSVEECCWNGDKTSVLIKVKSGKVLGKTITDFSEENEDSYSYLRSIEKKIGKSIDGQKQNTHVSSVIKKGKSKIAQKFGEEVVELVIEAAKENDASFKDEAADVFYYYLILLRERGFTLNDILKQLKLQKRKI